MRITRYEHATILVEHGDTRVLVDPGSYSGPERGEIGSLTAIVITHDHHDHCSPELITRLVAGNPGAPIYAPAAVVEVLGRTVEAPVRAVSPGEGLGIGDLSLEFVGGLHQTIHPSVPRSTNVGVVFEDPGGIRLFHPGDSYETAPEDITVLAVPLLGPWSSMAMAVDFAAAVAPQRMFPIHDVHLSEIGRDLFWPWIGRLAPEGIASFDLAVGEGVDVP